MSARLALLRDFSDHLSPMVVKELRHGLRTRAFMGMLSVFQWLMILVMLAGLLGVEPVILHNLFWSFALLALLVALPLRGFAALAGEMQGGTLDMLTLTSISATRIVWGKWAALFSQTLLVATSLLPYMVARYYLGGVEIFREGLVLLLAVLGNAVASAALVAFSAQRSVILRLQLAVGVAVALMPLTVLIFVMLNVTSGDSALRFFLALADWEQAGVVAAVLLLTGYCVYVFLTMGASRIAPASEDHSSRKRTVALGVQGVLMLVGLALCWHPEKEAILWTFIPAMILTLLIGTDVMTEEMPRFPSVVQQWMKKGLLGRMMRHLLYPGWASGVLFYTILCGMPLSTLIVKEWLNPAAFELMDGLPFVLCIFTAAVVPVCLRFNRGNRFANWCVVQIGLAVLGIFLAILVSITDSRELGFIGVITPTTVFFGSIDNYRNGEQILGLGAIVGALWCAAAWVLALREFGVYSALEKDARELMPASLPPEPSLVKVEGQP